jgi:hypothetical protein
MSFARKTFFNLLSMPGGSSSLFLLPAAKAASLCEIRVKIIL